MTNKDVTLVCPAYNNLEHLKNMYASFKKHCPEAKLILGDDGSTDETLNWIDAVHADDEQVPYIHSTNYRVGHTLLYDHLISVAETPIVGIIHADMIIGPNYLENMLKHIERGKVVCATRIEPPLHPPGKEKIIKDFGQDFDSLDIDAFENYVKSYQNLAKGKTTKGMFAPWIIYKEDFDRVDGHDDLFAPFPYEDSDIFQRWLQAGYELIQSRDAFVYHLTCRGHRWTEEVGKDDEYYKRAEKKARRNWFRKWGTWIDNDSLQHPILHKMFDVGIIVKECTISLLDELEPHAGTIYVDCDIEKYIDSEEHQTKFDLTERVKTIDEFNKNLHDVNIYINNGGENSIRTHYVKAAIDVHKEMENKNLKANSKYKAPLGDIEIEVNNI